MSSSNAGIAFFPPLPQCDVYRLRNKKACDVVMPKTFNKVVCWGCNKPKNQTYWEFLQSRVDANQWSICQKKWKGEEGKLKSVDTKGLDVTFLLKLIPEVCDNISKNGTIEWETAMKDSRRIEYLLKKAKDFRNEICHQPEGAAIAAGTLAEIETTLVTLVETSGTLYCIPQDDITREVDVIHTMVKEIRDTVTDREKRVLQIQRKLHTDGKREHKKTWELHYEKEILPFSKTKVNRSEVFHSMQLSIGRRGMQAQPSVDMSCEKLFQVWPGFTDTVNVIIIEGEAGAGKSTLIKRIGQDYLEIGSPSEIFTGVRQFNLLVYIECRKHGLATYGDLLKRDFPDTLKRISRDEAVEAVNDLNTLVLIDGYDEANTDSTKLVWEMIKSYKTNKNRTFIITSRPYAISEFENQLEDEEIMYSVCCIRSIGSRAEQIEFLERYQSVMPDINAPEMIVAFMRIPPDLYVHFVHAIYLALFCHLFQHSPEAVRNWAKDSDVMLNILKLCKSKMLEKLNRKRILNSKILIDEFMTTICRLSLEWFHQKILCLETKDYDKFCRDCYRDLSKEIPYDDMLSCVFTAKCSPSNPQETTYHYFHLALQEYFAALALAEAVNKDSNRSISQVLKTAVGKTVPMDDMKRYYNVLKFLTVELNDSKNEATLKRRLPELVKLMKASGADQRACAELVSSCGNSEMVARQMALAVNEDGSGWLVQDVHLMPASALMLRYRQPTRMLVYFRPGEQTVANMELILPTVREVFRGELSLNLHASPPYIPCDDIIDLLRGARCKLTLFVGCVASAAAVEVLASLVHDLHCQVVVSVPDALHHELFRLNNSSCYFSRIDVRYTAGISSILSLPPRPLPQTRGMYWSGPLTVPLTVHQVPSTGLEDTSALILALAPLDRRYDWLHLEACSLSPVALQQLLDNLQQAGIRTTGSDGNTRYQLISKGQNHPQWFGGCQSHHSDTSRCVVLHLPEETARLSSGSK